jgi:hypothetical protein
LLTFTERKKEDGDSSHAENDGADPGNLKFEGPFGVEWHEILLVPDAFAAIAHLREVDRPDQIQLAGARAAISLRISLQMSELCALNNSTIAPKPRAASVGAHNRQRSELLVNTRQTFMISRPLPRLHSTARRAA